MRIPILAGKCGRIVHATRRHLGYETGRAAHAGNHPRGGHTRLCSNWQDDNAWSAADALGWRGACKRGHGSFMLLRSSKQAHSEARGDPPEGGAAPELDGGYHAGPEGGRRRVLCPEAVEW